MSDGFPEMSEFAPGGGIDKAVKGSGSCADVQSAPHSLPLVPVRVFSSCGSQEKSRAIHVEGGVEHSAVIVSVCMLVVIYLCTLTARSISSTSVLIARSTLLRSAARILTQAVER